MVGGDAKRARSPGPNGLSTLAVRAGSYKDSATRAISTPIFQTTTFGLTDEVVEAMAAGTVREHLIYTRYGNPTVRACADKIAALEGGEGSLVFSSGMAAISSTMAAVLSPGDHLVSSRDLYGGTFALLERELPQMGVDVTLVDAASLDEVSDALRPSTRMIYVESLTNPLLHLADIPALAKLARRGGCVLAVDATFATPINQQPLKLGADIVLHSCSKFLNGHSDVIAGAVVTRDELVAGIWEKMLRFGGCLDPHAAYLLERGMKTLAIRMARHNENAQTTAEWLERNARIAAVYYPGLDSHPQRSLAKKLLSGYGGVVAFEVRGGDEAAWMFVQRLRLLDAAASLGGVESFVTLPFNTSHAALAPEERERIGIRPGLVRISVGIEDPGDIIGDIEQALGCA